MRKLTEKQRDALKLLARAKAEAVDGLVICAYGNEFFMAGMTDADGTCERNTLESLRKRGLAVGALGLTRRGEYRITDFGLQIIAKEAL